MRFLFIINIILVFTFFGCTNKNNLNKVKLGEVLPLTGPEGAAGTATHKGIQLAIEEINQKGGIKGLPIEVVALDNQSKTDESAIAITQLIQQKKVLAVIGSLTSSESLAMAPISQKHGIPMIAPTATHPGVTQMGDSIFRVCFMDAFQGKVISQFAKDHLKAQKVALFYDIKSDYSQGLAQSFSKHFLASQGKILMKQSYAAGDIDFRAQLTAIRAQSPEALIIPGHYTDVGLIIRQARELGLNIPILGGDAYDSPKLIEIAGKNPGRVFFVNHYTQDDPSPQVQKFVTQYQRKFGEIPDGTSALGYDATQIVLHALEKLQNPTSQSLKETLAQIKKFPGVTGLITFDSQRNVVKSAVILKIENGKTQYVTRIEDAETK